MTEYVQGLLQRTQTWGFVIYRTVYTERSDEIWPAAMDRLNDLVRSGFDKHNEEADQQNRDFAWDQFQTIIMEGRDVFDKADYDELARHFDTWVAGLGSVPGQLFSGTYKAFLVIDEATLERILDAPDDMPGYSGPPSGYTITAVEKLPDPIDFWLDEEDEMHYYEDDEIPEPVRTWQGYFPVSLYRIFEFWVALTGENDAPEMETKWGALQRRNLSEWTADVW
ncbi:hypothetical protein EJ06DRAFT_580304 [Trichodelitschia bisporula]|uniref:Uncharacterized protein n=1 Tax=Trichodelitschia bisporula TaxID=703511 RepID=A0A6G1I4C1_9PEZI|nr:hypothetical protein EJ06DRAFT_580304 [Trichodelitschia bisporula]